jgi:hypothetical protein
MGAANLFLFLVGIADWSKHDMVEMLLYILLVHAGDGMGGRPVRWRGSLRAARYCLCAGAGQIKSPCPRTWASALCHTGDTRAAPRRGS